MNPHYPLVPDGESKYWPATSVRLFHDSRTGGSVLRPGTLFMRRRFASAGRALRQFEALE